MSGNVYIPKPCHENWNKMSPDEKGRHCAVCSKVVTDFTNMKTEEIVATIQDSEREVCGRINIKQLTAVNKKQQFYFWIKGTLVPKIAYTCFAIFGLASIFKKSAWSQALPGQVMVNGGAKYEPQAEENRKFTVEVVNEYDKPVNNAVVQVFILGSEVSNTITKSHGSTNVEIEAVRLSVGYLYISMLVTADGYNPKEIQDVRLTKNGQTIRIKLNENVLLFGKMKISEPENVTIIEDPVTKKCVLEQVNVTEENPILIKTDPAIAALTLQEISLTNEIPTSEISWNPFLHQDPAALSFVSFPNPTMGDLTIETKQNENFDVKIYTETGVLLLQQSNLQQRTSIQLQGHAAGLYFAVIFINNKAIETHKIILVR